MSVYSGRGLNRSICKTYTGYICMTYLLWLDTRIIKRKGRICNDVMASFYISNGQNNVEPAKRERELYFSCSCWLRTALCLSGRHECHLEDINLEPEKAMTCIVIPSSMSVSQPINNAEGIHYYTVNSAAVVFLWNN